MRYTQYQGAIKDRMSRFSLLAIAVAFAITLAAGVFTQTQAATSTQFYQGFEEDTSGWFDNGGEVTRVPSGTNGVNSFEGDFHATVPEDGGPFTRWGGYEDTFPENGYSTSVAVYIDSELAVGTDQRLDFSSAINNPDGDHRRDFIFHLGTNPDESGVWCASVSNNAPGWPCNPARDPIEISDTGWYELVSNFRDNGSGILEVEMQILDSSGNEVGSWVLSDPTDIISVTVGGNRYGWFVTNDFAELPIDASQRYVVLADPADKDECKKGGWEDFGFRNQGQCIRFVNTGQDSR